MQEQLELYEKFLPYCPKEGLYKLMLEMVTMKTLIDSINMLTTSQAERQIITYDITLSSKINEDRN